MYYVILPEESFRSEPEKVIVDSIKMDILKKNYISEIAKDPKNVSLSGETKAYEKEILKNIFRSQGIVPVTYAERYQIDSDLEDIKAYNLGIKSENDIDTVSVDGNVSGDLPGGRGDGPGAGRHPERHRQAEKRG